MKIKTQITQNENQNHWIDADEAKRNPGIYEKDLFGKNIRYISVDGKLFCVGDGNPFYESACYNPNSRYRKVDEKIVVEFG